MGDHALSAADRSALSAEQGPVSMAVGGLMVFTGGPGIAYERVLERVRTRLGLIPRYRHRLRAPAPGLHPVWTDDDDFELRWHVRRTTLSAPGGPLQLADVVGSEMSRRLDRSRPLWELTVIEGLAGDRVGLLAKMHHALVDGVAAVDIGTVLLDPTPEPLDLGPKAEWVPREYDRARHLADAGLAPLRSATRLARGTAERALGTDPLAAAPSDVDRARAARMLAITGDSRRALAELRRAADPRRATEELRRATDPRRAAGELRRTAEDVRRATDLVAELARQRPAAPMTPLNRPIGPNRRAAHVRTDLAGLKAAGKRAGGTVNDAILAVVAGALARTLAAAGEPVRADGRSPVALVPVSVRRSGEEGGNRISTVLVDLPCATADPLERVATLHAAMAALKDSAAVRAGALLVGATGLAPPLISSTLARALGGVRAFNVVVSNVPGPREPFFLDGCRLEEIYPAVPLNPASQGLTVGVLSYAGGVHFGLLADRDLAPPVAEVAEHLQAALGELLVAGVSSGAR